MQGAHAVHLPPTGDSCIGVTLRLVEPAYDRERLKFAERFSEPEVEAALGASGVAACSQQYLDNARRSDSEEKLTLRMAYAIDPEGRVCAVVEPTAPELYDPAAAEMVEAAHRCAKAALFQASFPKGRVEDKDRAVRWLELEADPVRTSTGA